MYFKSIYIKSLGLESETVRCRLDGLGPRQIFSSFLYCSLIKLAIRKLTKPKIGMAVKA